MKVTIKDIRDKFDALGSGAQSRESIAKYAFLAMEADDNGALEIDNDPNDKIWKSIIYLSGVDLQGDPGMYIHTSDDFVKARQKLGV